MIIATMPVLLTPAQNVWIYRTLLQSFTVADLVA